MRIFVEVTNPKKKDPDVILMEIGKEVVAIKQIEIPSLTDEELDKATNSYLDKKQIAREREFFGKIFKDGIAKNANLFIEAFNKADE